MGNIMHPGVHPILMNLRKVILNVEELVCEMADSPRIALEVGVSYVEFGQLSIELWHFGYGFDRVFKFAGRCNNRNCDRRDPRSRARFL